MKALRLIFVALMLSTPVWAWNCTQPGQIRVQVPNGTVGNGIGDGPGQVVTVEGITFQCQTPPKQQTPPTNVTTTSNTLNNTNTSTNQNSNSNTNNNTSSSNSSSTSNATSNQKQQQQQTQTQTATGGNANSSANASGGNATSNGDNSNNTTINEAKIPVAQAYAPTALPTVPCFKGFSGGAQTVAFGGSFGGGKVDTNCAILETARSFGIAGSWLAYCKTMATDKYAKAAGVTVEDCLKRYTPPAPVILAPPAPASVPETKIVVVPVTVNAPAPPPALPVVRTEITVTAPRKKPVKHLAPACQNGLELRCVAPRSQEK